MRIQLTTISNRTYMVEKPYQIAFVQTVGAACDALSVSFNSAQFIDEIVGVKAFIDKELVFSGYCDNQRITQDEDGMQVYFYARSSASLLLDNQAEPFTYNMPTARQLCLTFADKYGFECCLPAICSQNKYEVEKGVSCWGAINNFVSLLTGSTVYVTPDNKLKVFEKSEDIKSLNDYKILSACAVTNRSEPVSEISYKREASSGYVLHTASALGREIGVNREQFVNLSSLPQWQRENTTIKRLKDSYSNYKILEVAVAGFVQDRLYQSFSYTGALGTYDDYILTEKKYTLDKNGSRTRLTLRKIFDVKEITYVD